MATNKPTQFRSIQTPAAVKKLVKRRNKRVLLFVSHSPISHNSPIKAYIRLPLKQILKTLQEDSADSGSIDVVYLDECGTTKYCSFSYKEQYVAPSPHRFVRCNNCQNVNEIISPPLKWRTSRYTSRWLSRTEAEAAAEVNRKFNRDIGGGRGVLTGGYANITGHATIFMRGLKRRSNQPI